MRTAGIERVWLTPDGVRASEDALAAIAEADLIVLGPGSLFTSLLPSLLIPAIRDAILAAPCPRFYICNVATQDGETTGLDLAAHVEALVAHTSANLIDVVLANDHLTENFRGTDAPKAVRLRWPPAGRPMPRLILDDLVDPTNPHHHDPARLAAAVIRALEHETGIRHRTAMRATRRTA